MIFADPPYFLSNGGTTCKNGKNILVNKGDWDKSKGFEEDYLYQKQWLKECKRGDAKWLDSFQHKKKCIDLTEFKQYLESTFSQDIDFSDFDRIFQDTREQIDPLP